VRKRALRLFGASFLHVPAAFARPWHASIEAKLFERLTCSKSPEIPVCKLDRGKRKCQKLDQDSSDGAGPEESRKISSAGIWYSLP
jgi:hypothetical protein